jgi:hypothetical protein
MKNQEPKVTGQVGVHLLPQGTYTAEGTLL